MAECPFKVGDQVVTSERYALGPAGHVGTVAELRDHSPFPVRVAHADCPDAVCVYTPDELAHYQPPAETATPSHDYMMGYAAGFACESCDDAAYDLAGKSADYVAGYRAGGLADIEAKRRDWLEAVDAATAK